MKLNSRGLSLVEIVIAAALMGIVALISSSILSSQSTSMRYVAQKSEILDLREQLLMAFQSPEACSCQLNPGLTTDNSNDANLQWNPAVVDGSAVVNVKRLKTGCALTSPVIVQEGQAVTSDLVVARVDLAALQPTGAANEWLAKVRVSFTNRNDRVPIAPVEIEQIVLSAPNPSAPGTVIAQACKGPMPRGLISACPAGSVLVGPPNAIGSYCINSAPKAAAGFLASKAVCANDRPAGFGPAHLCDHSEFFTACKEGLLDLTTGTTPGELEYLGDFDSIYAMTFKHVTAGAETCNGVLYATIGTSLRYRCCWR